MSKAIRPLASVALTAFALAVAGCGSDSSSTADSTSTAAPGSAGQQSTGATTSSDATTQDGGMTATVTDGKITVKATEFMFDPMNINTKAGKLTITMENDGVAVHELVVLKTSKAADALEATNGKVSEKDSVGEISETNPGKSKSTTFDLEAGTYVIVCNIPGHYMKGMRGTLTVS